MSDGNLDYESSPAFFEAKYGETGDPWNFSSDPYELSRYDAIIKAVCHQSYKKAYEPGCSIGVLTERLAEHCGVVYAEDFSALAVAHAQTRCAHLPNVRIRCAALGSNLMIPDFDLLLLSEIGYYFAVEEWQRVSFALVDSLRPGATVLAAHWLGRSSDHRISGDEVHEVLLSHPALQLEHAQRNQSMRLDRLVRR